MEWTDQIEPQGCDLPSAGAFGMAQGSFSLGAAWRARCKAAKAKADAAELRVIVLAH